MFNKLFLFFLVDTPTGLVWVKNADGTFEKVNIRSGRDCSLANAPGSWMDQELSFIRNTTYWGINRSFSEALQFIKDSADIIRNQYYGGNGIECPFTLVIYKYNDNSKDGEPTYKHEYSGGIDLAKGTDVVAESYNTNLIQGGVLQLFKAYENTLFTLPCDGSIPENVKVNCDGMLVEDTLYYNMIQFNYKLQPGQTGYVIPMAYVNNDGENYGVVKSDPSFDTFSVGVTSEADIIASTLAYASQAPTNFISFSSPTRVHIKARYSTQGYADLGVAVYGTMFATNLGQFIWITGKPASTGFVRNDYPVIRLIDIYIDLQANERLFLLGFVLGGAPGTGIQYNSGSFNISFASKPNNTRAWGISARNVYKLLVQAICKASSTSAQVFNYLTSSALLDRMPGIILHPGDSLRASGDPNYQKYFQQYQINTTTPGVNFTTAYGPVLKTSISDFFKFCHVVLFAALGNENKSTNVQYRGTSTLTVTGSTTVTFTSSIIPEIVVGSIFIWQGINYKIVDYTYDINSLYALTVDRDLPPIATYFNQTFTINELLVGEYLFIELMNYVLDVNRGQLETGEVANLKVAFADDLAFTSLKIGYAKQTYDQKAGKYEWNTSAQWISPLKSLNEPKELQLICPYNAAPTIIERLRSDITETSTTQNDNDNTIHILNADVSSFIMDYQSNKFDSVITDITNSNNTNQRLALNSNSQQVNANVIDGSFLSINNDPSVFVFSYPSFSASKLLTFTFNGNLTGLPLNALTGNPADYITINLHINGVIIYTRTFTSTSAFTNFTDTFTVTRTFIEGDCVYATASTSNSGATDDLTATIDIGVAGAYWSATGTPIPVLSGSYSQMLALPNITAPLVGGLPVVAYGFQYFEFNSLLNNPQFVTRLQLATTMNGGTTSDFVRYDYYRNGQIFFTNTINATGSVFNPPPIDTLLTPSAGLSLTVGDIFFVLATTTNVNVQITHYSLTFTSTNIIAYNLKRKQYDSINGIPSLLGKDSSGRLITIGAGAPYNIEDLTPLRLLIKHFPYLVSILWYQRGRALQFSALEKNNYLSTTSDGVTLTERADIPISSMGAPLFYPHIITNETNVPITFSELMTGAANSHITQLYAGIPITGFPMSVKQKPALNEKQNWQLLMSPSTDPRIFMDLDINGLNYLYMPPNSIWSSMAQSIKCVSVDQSLNPLYRTPNPDLFLFSQTVSGWLNKSGYSKPWQIGVDIPLQFVVTGYTPVEVKFYKEDGTLVSTTSFDNIAAPGLSTTPDKQCWQGGIPTDGLEAGCYYYIANAGGVDGVFAQSECIGMFEQDYSLRILRFDYSHSKDKGILWVGTGFKGISFVEGFFDNRDNPNFTAAFFVDQPQDIILLNGITYTTKDLYITGQGGVPDYVMKHYNTVLMFDNVRIEDIGISFDLGANWETVDVQKGVPKRFWKTRVRLTDNEQGITITAAGGSVNGSLIATIDAAALSPNASNQSGSSAPDLINFEINNP